MKVQNLKLFMFSFSHCRVDRFSSKRIALKVDVIGPGNILFAGAIVRIQPGNFTGWGSEGLMKAYQRTITQYLPERQKSKLV